MRTHKHLVHGMAVVFCIGVGFLCMEGVAEQASKPMNVLFIGVDDLRPQLESYGFPQMKTPNMNRLATMGMQFNRAYVQQAICSASRASLLTGCRPDATGVNYPYSPWFNDVFRKEYPTIVEHFTRNGYYTRTLGKIHHGPVDKEMSESHYGDKAPLFLLPENQFEGHRSSYTTKLKPWEHADLPDSRYGDAMIANETIATIRRAVKQDKPFFIAPGFKKPHLPFVCPKKYYDLYSDEDIELSPNPKRGPNQPLYTIQRCSGAYKWWKYPDVKEIEDKDARQLIHSYYACVSFVDAQVGRILDELEKQKLLDSTIILLWSDHGWHLGDHSAWGKSTNYEWSTRSPVFLYVPGIKETGKQTDALVEFVDFYPTLLELSGLKIPDYLEGTSMVPLLDDAFRPWKKAVFSQYPRSKKEYGPFEGYSVRTKDYRYTQWRKHSDGKVFFEELYDNRVNLLETKNVAGSPKFKDVLEKHRKILAAGWKSCLPPEVVNNSDLPKGDDSWYADRKKKKTIH